MAQRLPLSRDGTMVAYPPPGPLIGRKAGRGYALPHVTILLLLPAEYYSLCEPTMVFYSRRTGPNGEERPQGVEVLKEPNWGDRPRNRDWEVWPLFPSSRIATGVTRSNYTLSRL